MAEVSPLRQLELGSLQDEQSTRLLTLADLIRNVICELCKCSRRLETMRRNLQNISPPTQLALMRKLTAHANANLNSHQAFHHKFQ